MSEFLSLNITLLRKGKLVNMLLGGYILLCEVAEDVIFVFRQYREYCVEFPYAQELYLMVKAIIDLDFTS